MSLFSSADVREAHHVVDDAFGDAQNTPYRLVRSVGFMFKKSMAIALLALVAASASFWIVRVTTTTGSPTNPEEGLTDSERMELHAEAVAETARLMRQDALAFEDTGLSIDSIPRAEIRSSASLETTDLAAATKAAELVVLVESEGAYVDEKDARLHLRLRVIETYRGSAQTTTDVVLSGGPQKADDGSWLLALAPSELYLAKGDTAVLFLERVSEGEPLVQRSYEAMLIKEGKIVPRERFAFNDSLANVPVDQALQALAEAAQ